VPDPFHSTLGTEHPSGRLRKPSKCARANLTSKLPVMDPPVPIQKYNFLYCGGVLSLSNFVLGS